MLPRHRSLAAATLGLLVPNSGDDSGGPSAPTVEDDSATDADEDGPPESDDEPPVDVVVPDGDSPSDSTDQAATPDTGHEGDSDHDDGALTVGTGSAARQYPRRPDPFLAEDAAEYVLAYEKAYVMDQILGDDAATAGVDTWGAEVRRVPEGFVVTVRALYWHSTTARRTGRAVGTWTDDRGPEYHVAYLLADDRLVRAEGDYYGAPDPRDGGHVVEHWSA